MGPVAAAVAGGAMGARLKKCNLRCSVNTGFEEAVVPIIYVVFSGCALKQCSHVSLGFSRQTPVTHACIKPFR